MTGTFADDLLAHSRRAPDAPAVVTGDGSVSYGALAGRVGGLAGALRARGAGPEQVCAVGLPRGVDAVAAVAAVAVTGAASWSLDPDLPPDRVADLAASAGPTLLVTSAELAGRLAGPVGTPVLDVGTAGTGPVTPHPADPRSLAYVSHTSGSTGSPNAVLVEHRGLRGHLRALVDEHALGPADTVLQVAPAGYDAAVRDVFATLGAGARLVVLPREQVLTPAGFAAAVAAHRVTALLSATPTLLVALAADPRSAGALRSLRLVLSSGESLRPFLAAGYRARVRELVNQYGPTETTLTATRYAVPGEPDGDDLVGTARPGVTARVVDPDDLHELAPGDVGEVLIGGAGVARGYRGRPGATAAAFVPDPQGPPGARAYRTGDLARVRADGGLEYRGRRDRQLKVRGHRVEPGEVEGALLRHDDVASAVVVPEVDDLGRTHLVAHVTGVPDTVTDRALRAFLAARLPPHLLPRRVERRERLPLTRTGKTDRGALAGARR